MVWQCSAVLKTCPMYTDLSPFAWLFVSIIFKFTPKVALHISLSLRTQSSYTPSRSLTQVDSIVSSTPALFPDWVFIPVVYLWLTNLLPQFDTYTRLHHWNSTRALPCQSRPKFIYFSSIRRHSGPARTQPFQVGPRKSQKYIPSFPCPRSITWDNIERDYLIQIAASKAIHISVLQSAGHLLFSLSTL